MTSISASEFMPDFTEPHFFDQVAGLTLDAERLGYAVVSAYLVSLTALMYGLDVEIVRSQQAAKTTIGTFLQTFKRPDFYRIRQGSRVVHFWSSASETSVTAGGAREASDKTRTKPILHHAGVATPFGGAATAKDLSILQAFASAKVNRVVVKPISGSSKKDIRANQTLAQAQQYIMSSPDVVFIVEQYIKGTEVRMQVVGQSVVSTILQMPQHVVGDGLSTLAQLVDRRTEMRRTNPIRTHYLIDENKYFLRLLDRDIVPSMVPAVDQTIWLTNDTVVGPMTDHFDYSDRISEAAKASAVATAKCFGVKITAIDAIIDRNGETFVLELNSKPGIDTACFPLQGKWNLDVPEAIVKLHFPKLKKPLRKVQRYDFLAMAEDYIRQTERSVFKARDYITFS